MKQVLFFTELTRTPSSKKQFSCYSVLLIFILLVTNSFAQPAFDWGKNIGGKHWDVCQAMVLDSSDNVFMAGNFMGDVVNFGNGLNVSTNGKKGSKMFISKSDKDGSILWVKEIGNAGTGTYLSSSGLLEVDSMYILPTAIDTDQNGSVYITGTFSGTFDFDPGTNIHKLSEPTAYSIAVPTYDVFILKLDKDGDFEWVRQYGAINDSEIAGSIKVGSDNMVYATGNTGDYVGTVDFDPGVGVSSLPFGNMYVLKLKPNGDFVWVKGIKGAGATIGDGGLSLDASNNLFIGGTTNGVVDFDPGLGEQIESPIFLDPNEPSYGGYDYCFVLKLTDAGDFKWVAKHNVGILKCVTTDKMGNVYYSVKYEGHETFDADPNAGIVPFTVQHHPSYGTGQSMYIIKLDSEKKFIFGKEIAGNGNVEASSIVVNSENTIYITGGFSIASYAISDPPFTMDFDPGVGVVNPVLDPIWRQNHFKMYMLKLNENGTFNWFGDFGLLDVYTNSYRNMIELAVSKSECELFMATSIGTFSTGGIGAPADTHEFEPRDYDPSDSGEFKITTNGYNDIYLSKFMDHFKPVITPLSSVNFCEGDSVVLDAGTTYTSYSWSPTNETSRMITVKTSGNYSVTTTKECGTGISDTVTTKVTTKPSVKIEGKNSICIGDIDTLKAVGAKTYVWNTGSIVDSTIVSPAIATWYKVIGTDSIGCVNSDSVNVVVNSIPLATASIDKTICQNESITLTGSGGTTSLWSTGETTNSITVSPTKDSIYIYTAMNGGCIDVDSVNVFVKVSPIVTLTPATGFTMTQGSEANLTATGTGAYSWSPALGLSCDTCASITVNPSKSTEYCVTVTNTDSCQTTKCIKIEIACGELFVPNGFSPNGDNINDKLEVKINSECVTDYNLLIYDRWGEKVFEATKVTDSWDGKFEGKELDNAVFVYYVKLKLKDNVDPIVKKGNVSIIK